MDDRTIYRLGDVVDAIDNIDLLLTRKNFSDLQADHFLRAAFERLLEIVSEASRNIPPEMKLKAPQIPWRRIADIGNHLRDAYHKVDAEILWLLHAEGELARLRDVAAIIVADIKREKQPDS